MGFSALAASRLNSCSYRSQQIDISLGVWNIGSEMMARNTSRIIWGIFGALICLMLIVFAVEHGKNHGIPSLGLEPEYDGHPLSYWLDDSFRYYGAERVTNSNASAAVHSIATNALPFLIHWIQTPIRSSQDPDLQSRALVGFVILGPEAKPAIPDLIKIIGRDSNWPAMALSYVGPDVVPPLIELLQTNRTADSGGNRRRGVFPRRDREYAIMTLNMLGTNAEAALPVLMQCYGDEAKRSRADVASALARIGLNQPEVIVPALIYLLANSNGFGQLEAAEALGSLGNKAESAIPALLLAGQSKDAQLQIAAAVAIKKIEPRTPDALAPLILNLRHREDYVREQAVRGLEKLGTNGTDAKSALLECPAGESREDPRSCNQLFESVGAN